MPPSGILITGATGFVGGHLTRAGFLRGTRIWAISRDAQRARARLPEEVEVVAALTDIPEAEPIDAIVDLAGAPVIGPPWTRGRRRVLVASRVQTTESVIAWCAGRAIRPGVLISASAIGFYGPAQDEWLDETAPAQPRSFQSRLCMARETAADGARALDVRVVNLRLGVVLGADGGILPRLALPAKLGMAAVIGDGRQWMSWIHIDDLLRVIELAIGDQTLAGAVNAVAPAPVRQRDFERALTQTLRRPLWLRLPAFALRAALGEMAELLVRGQRVAPGCLAARGFEFLYPRIEAAIDACFTRARS